MRRMMLLAVVSLAVAVVAGAGGARPSSVRDTQDAIAAPCAVDAGTVSSSAGVSLSFVRGSSVLLASADASRISTVLRGHGTGDASVWWYDPAWSRDGRCLATSVGSFPTGSHEYVDVVVRRGMQKPFAVPGGMSAVSGSPSWSPDGRRLVLVGYQSGWFGGGLYIRGVGLKADKELTPEVMDARASFDDHPAWSPDGSKIAFARTLRRQTGLYVIRPDGRGLRRLATVSGRNPSWSPDSRRLGFDDGRRIAVINTDGSALRYLTALSASVNTDPAWSPDGKTIAFSHHASAKSKVSDIWLMNSDGGNQRLFVKNGSQAAWKAQ